MEKLEGIKQVNPIPEPRTLIIREGSLETKGFQNLYEVLGFIDIQANPQILKQIIMQNEQKKTEQPKQGSLPR